MTRSQRTRVLLDRLCIELGFCLPPTEEDQLIASPPPSVRDFTNAVFVAEGLDPEFADRHLWRQVRDRVAEHFRRMEGDDAFGDPAERL